MNYSFGILQCSTWNYGADYECKRCEAPQNSNSYPTPFADRGKYEEDGHYDDDRGRRHTGYDDKDRRRDRRSSGADDDNGETSFAAEQELDEFGRIVSSKPPQKTKWPPSFETDGSAFVFDTRSGMFYESHSDFFYDPKSKLYYGNKQGAYFRCNSNNSKIFFEAVQKVDSQYDDTAAVAPIPPSNSSTAQSKKVSISINLKTKELPAAVSNKSSTKKAKKDAAAANEKKVPLEAPAAPVVFKKHTADMDKWSERQVEKRQQGDAAAQQPQLPAADESQCIATTAKGEPICLLCRRKFPTLEKLQYHEQVSNLHKDNLLKQATTTNAAAKEAAVDSKNASSAYVDRAQRRRIMHGPEHASSISTINSLPVQPMADLQSVVSLGSQSQGGGMPPSLKPPMPQDNLGESNIGNMMLQKLGWKAGSALGRQNPQQRGNNGGVDSAADTVSQLQQQPVATMVKQDWERIESMAASNGGKSRSTLSSGGVGSHRFGSSSS